MKLSFLLVLMPILLVLSPQHARSANDYWKDNGFTCDFLPTDQMSVGYVYRENPIYQFPARFDRKYYPVTNEFQDKFAGYRSFSVAGEKFSSSHAVDIKLAAGVLGVELTPEQQSSIKAKFAHEKTVNIVREYPAHVGVALTDVDAGAVKDWFQGYKTSKSYAPGDKYYLVREIRKSHRLVYKVAKSYGNEFLTEGQAIKGVDFSAEVKSSGASDYEIDGEFNDGKELTFCVKVERLK